MHYSSKKLKSDIKTLVVIANILVILIIVAIISIITGSEQLLFFATPVVFLSIGIISIVLAITPNLQKNTRGFTTAIITSFLLSTVLLLITPLNMGIWAEVITLIAFFIAVIIAIIQRLLRYEEEKNVISNQQDIKNRMRDWVETDRYLLLSKEEADEIRTFLDKHNIK